ncbi:hypothetical protein BH10CYA1_BH10CYA1_54840 [soil metagenome]
MQIKIRLAVFLALAISLTSLSSRGYCADEIRQGGVTASPLTQAEKWVKQRSMPSWMGPDEEEKKEKKRSTPVRSLIKTVAKGTAKELGASLDGMAKDMVFVFSVQDIDPYEKKGPPKNKPAIVLKMTMMDGSTAYLRRFPDNSFAVEDGFADGTVLVPTDRNQYIIKYPNGFNGKVVITANTIVVYRPDKSITTFKKTMSGGYSATNDKLGYMGEARPDRTGVHYEVGEW